MLDGFGVVSILGFDAAQFLSGQQVLRRELHGSFQQADGLLDLPRRFRTLREPDHRPDFQVGRLPG